MVNIRKQVEYWREGAREDWRVGAKLVEEGEVRHGLFFIHLALEKALKAHVCRATRNLAPKIHDLAGLAARAGMELEGSQREALMQMTAFNLVGRYPNQLLPAPTHAEAREHLAEAREIFEWLMREL
jgi:HEPN domain-containing protein